MPSLGLWTNAEKDAINDWVKAKFPGCEGSGVDSFTCKTCGHPCLIDDHVVGVPGQGILGLSVGATRANGFSLTCTNCGQQHLYDNAVAGIF